MVGMWEGGIEVISEVTLRSKERDGEQYLRIRLRQCYVILVMLHCRYPTS